MHDRDVEIDDSVADYFVINGMSVNGRALKLVDAPSAGMCSVDHLELWTADLTTYLRDATASLGDTSTVEFVEAGRQTFLVRGDRKQQPSRIDALGFDASLHANPICQIAMESQAPEEVLSSADDTLCAAVRAGAVEEVHLTTVPPIQLTADDHKSAGLGDTYQDAQLEMYARGTVDLANDGHPVPIAMIRSMGEATAGCGHWDLSWQWPVVTNPNGTILPSARLNGISHDAGGASARSIRYRGKTYLDGTSSSDDGFGPHFVSEITTAVPKKMCTLNPARYVVIPERH